MRATLHGTRVKPHDSNGGRPATRTTAPIRYICPYGHHSSFYVLGPAEPRALHSAILTARGNIIGGPEKGRWWIACVECGERFMADVEYVHVEIDRGAF